jgi:3-mercaptopyruvate sulfurtransferase SseA
MSFDSLLRHTVTIYRDVAVLDAGEPTYDELGHPVTSSTAVGTWQCRIQQLTAREVAQFSQAGPALSDHRIFGRIADVRASDRLVATDGREYEVQAVPADAGGQGHHFEVLAKYIESESPAEA